MKNLANYISVGRILCSVMLIIFPAFSFAFFVFYSLAGLSDILDGFIARKLKISSKFGERLDTTADFVFIIIVITVIFNNYLLTKTQLLLIIISILIKLISIMLNFFIKKVSALPHSLPSKILGFVLFLMPYFINLINLNLIIIFCCFISIIINLIEIFFYKNSLDSPLGV